MPSPCIPGMHSDTVVIMSDSDRTWRFMQNMPTALRERVDEFAELHGITRTGAVNFLVSIGLKHQHPDPAAPPRNERSDA
jgi:hypothetical protein